MRIYSIPNDMSENESIEEYLSRIGALNNQEKKEDDCISQRD